MKRLVWAILCSGLLTLPAHAEESGVKQTYQSLAYAISKADPVESRLYLTEASQPLFNRFVSYDLLRCLPKDVKFTSSKEEGNVAITKGTFRSKSGKFQIVTLAFLNDGTMWKLDLPETLKRAMGKNWETMLGFTEALYLSIRQQAGGSLSCEQIEGVAKGS